MRSRSVGGLIAVAVALTGIAALAPIGLHGQDAVRSAARARTIEGVAQPFQEVVVSAPARKPIASISVNEGDVIAKGEELAMLEADVEELEMNRFAKVLEKRLFENEAAESLAKDGIISEDEALERRIELDIAKLQHEIARQQYLIHRIESPIDGVVVDRFKDVGETATEAEPMFRLVDLRRIFVQCYLPAEDVFLLKPGDVLPVTFPLLPEDRRLVQGKVDFVSPVIDGSSGLLRVKVLIENPDSMIKAGMRGTVGLPQP